MGMEILKSGTFIHDWGLNREILLVTQFVVNLIFIETLPAHFAQIPWNDNLLLKSTIKYRPNEMVTISKGLIINR